MADSSSKLKTTPIAIIGVAGIFPEALNVKEYWDNIVRKIDCITDVPLSRWDPKEYYNPDPTVPDRVYCKRGGFIPDVDFDPMEFGLPPNILEITDVSQLLGLVAARDALEDAGYGEGREFTRDRTGVILGVVGMSMKIFTPLMARMQYPVWEKVLRASGVPEEDIQKIVAKMEKAFIGWEENSFPGAIANVIAGRIANRFDLGGTNCVIDAACGSSLAAVRMALDELITGRADMMITGGVDTDNSISTYMCFSKTPAFTKSDRVSTFDADSAGMMVGEGLGMLVLKRLADAERDHDRIYAVIKGLGTSSDGRFKSIYAPRPSGQAKAVRRAYQQAGFDLKSIGLVEAHGTGTGAGDPAEFQGMREAFGEGNDRRQYIALGSVKSQIAHTKAAAGAAGLIKTALALHHKVLPPTINVKKPNPKFEIETSPFYINTELRPWIQSDPATPRRAGVSSFGFGGTNYHVAMEEYTGDHADAYRLHTVAQPVLFSAPTPTELLARCEEVFTQLAGKEAQAAFRSLTEASRGGEIPVEHARLGFVADSVQEAAETLQTGIDLLKSKLQDDAWEHPKGIYYRKHGAESKGKVVALFPGQGSQYVDMGSELAVNFPPVRQCLSSMDQLFLNDQLPALSTAIYPAPVFTDEARGVLDKALQRTDRAQPAIGVFSVGLFKLLEQAGFKPDFTAGHSFGELTALWAGGVVSELDYYQLAKARGKAMAPPADPNFDAGTMMAIKGDVEKVREELKAMPEITLANWNSYNQVVIAGSKADMARAAEILSAKGFSTVQLPVSAAFHTPLVGHAQKPFAEVVQAMSFHKPARKVYSNTTGKAYSADPKSIKKILTEHILNPVMWKDEIESIYADGGYFFVECGPKNVLTNLVNNILGDRPHVAISLNPSPKKGSDRQFREAVIALRVAGLNLDNVDPYQAPHKKAPSRKNSPVTVKLNGGYYITEKTRKSFQDALKDPEPRLAPANAVQTQPAVSPAKAIADVVPTNGPAPVLTVSAGVDFPVFSEDGLDGYQQLQNQAAGLHEKYLQNEAEYARIYSSLTQQEIDLIGKASSNPEQLAQVAAILEGLERSMAQFHAHQAETLRVHDHYLAAQEEFSRNFYQLLQQPGTLVKEIAPKIQTKATPVEFTRLPVQPVKPAPIQPQPVVTATAAKGGNGSSPAETLTAKKPLETPVAAPIPAAPAAKAEDVQAAILRIVSEKTGYPVETLDLSMDMEADLGIDSIKRVEILGAVREVYPGLPKVEPEVFAEMRTLDHVIQHVNRVLGAGVVSQPQATPAQVVAVQPSKVEATSPAEPANPIVASGRTMDEVRKSLLQVVSEKTGYPVETLDVTMDMEADLGIDSIKRVEILGAMRELYPDFPKVSPEEFSELRTLDQVIQHLGKALKVGVAEGKVEQIAQPKTAAAAPAEKVTSPAQVARSAGEIVQSLLKVVSEKTGYPPETLDLDMDMEADLGIDSIKRVEILGAVREIYPDLPKVAPEIFAEMRTLRHVSTHIESALGTGGQATVQPAQAAAAVSSGPVIPQGVVAIKPLPAPDALEMTPEPGSVCLVTDDGAGTATVLTAALTKRGWKPVVLSLPENLLHKQSPLPENVRRIVLHDLGEETLKGVLADLQAESGPVQGFVHLDPFRPGGLADGDLFPETEEQIVKFIFMIAKYLKDPLNRKFQKGRSAFITVTRLDGSFGLAKGSDFVPVSGGLSGLVKTLNREWEAVYCRAIDLQPKLDGDGSAQRILAELYDPNRLIAEVGYGPQGRITLVVEDGALEGVK